MPLKPVQKVLVSDGVFEQIREMIHQGEFPQGSRLPSEMKMAEALSVSRSSLREALNALVHLGYLYRQNKGLYVSKKEYWHSGFPLHLTRSLKDQRIAEMIEARQIIEGELCARAAQRATQKDLKELEKILGEMETRLQDPMAFSKLNH